MQIVVDQSCNGDIGQEVGPLVQVLSEEERTYLLAIAQMKLSSLDSFLLCKTIVNVVLQLGSLRVRSSFCIRKHINITY